jgi:hypothetical protein
MVAPLAWIVWRAACAVNGMCYDAKRWDSSLPPAERIARFSGVVHDNRSAKVHT